MIIGVLCPHCQKTIAVSVNVEKINIMDQPAAPASISQEPQHKPIRQMLGEDSMLGKPIKRQPGGIVKRGKYPKVRPDVLDPDEKAGAEATLNRYHEMKKRKQQKALEKAKQEIEKHVGYPEDQLDKDYDEIEDDRIECKTCNHARASHLRGITDNLVCQMELCSCRKFEI